MTKISPAKFEALKTAASAKAERLGQDEIRALATELKLDYYTVAFKLISIERDKPIALPAVAWESDKAVGVDLSAEFTLDPTIARTSGLRARRERLFFPKSMVKAGAVPGWLWDKKVTEARAKLPSGYDFVFG